MRHLISTVSCLCLTAGMAFAQNCKTVPTCESLGYDTKVSNCSGKKYLTCPFDSSKIFCSDVNVEPQPEPELPSLPNLNDFPGCKELSWTGTEYKCSKCYKGYYMPFTDGKCLLACDYPLNQRPDSVYRCSYLSCDLEDATGVKTYYSECKCSSGSYKENGECKDGSFLYIFGNTKPYARLVYDDGKVMKFMYFPQLRVEDGMCSGEEALNGGHCVPQGEGPYSAWRHATKDELIELLEGEYFEFLRKEGEFSNVTYGRDNQALYGTDAFYTYWSSTEAGDGKLWHCSVYDSTKKVTCEAADKTSTKIKAFAGYVLTVDKSTIDSKCEDITLGEKLAFQCRL